MTPHAPRLINLATPPDSHHCTCGRCHQVRPVYGWTRIDGRELDLCETCWRNEMSERSTAHINTLSSRIASLEREVRELQGRLKTL